jgi:hypothetical protein
MAVFEFDVKPTTYRPDVTRHTKSNSLFRLLETGYSYHIPIIIRPDDILNAVGCIWAKYIVKHAEQFRDFFVSHSGQKTLTYLAGGTYAPHRLQEFMTGLRQLIRQDQPKDNLAWLEGAYSTTTVSDAFVRSAVALASQKEYYQYKCVLCCGFPKVTLDGLSLDWEALMADIRRMPTPDAHLEVWRDALVDCISDMLSGDEDFWQRCATGERYGSGGQQKYTGWIQLFNPINENGDWLQAVDSDDILDLTVDFPLHINDNGNEFDISVAAGMGLELKDDTLQIVNKTKIGSHELVEV